LLVQRLIAAAIVFAFVAVAPAALAQAAPQLLFVGADGKTLDEHRGFTGIAATPPPTDGHDGDAVRVVAAATADKLPSHVTVASVAAPDGGGRASTLEVLRDVTLRASPCPAGLPAGVLCASTGPIRPVLDDIDRNHPLLDGRAVLAEVGGALVASSGGARRTVRLTGPQGRHRARLRVHLAAMAEGGAPPIGRDVNDAIELVRGEVARASAIWGACGISFGPPGAVEARIAPPPPPFLLSLGCGVGLPASGGEIRLSADGVEIAVPVGRGVTPRGAARLVAAALERKGFVATVSDNAPIAAASLGTSDVLVRRRGGKLVALAAPKAAPISSDATLEVCIGRVALEDGLQHFADADAIAGTLEERTLIKAYEDGDPSTIEVFVVPSFGGDARIGESFIFADGGAIKNVVIEDRAGFRAHRASFTLAHELGHVLLDQPGHPDDFGIDTPTRLMDADAVNPSAFGPRRLDPAECARALRQSGPGTPSNILSPWPLAPLP
jgi:hypothetical protein